MSDDIYDSDPAHPIPRVDVLDIKGVRNDGGVDLVIVIASPLAADERSLKRLVQKLRNYLGLVKAEQVSDFSKRFRVIVDIDMNSDKQAVGYLRRCSEWVFENGAELVVNTVDRTAPGGKPSWV